MSWKTMLEITVFMLAAAAVGVLLGFVIGVVSKAAKSAFDRSREFKREKRDLEVKFREVITARDLRINALEHELEASERQTSDLIASHERFREEVMEMSELSLTSFGNLDQLREQYDDVWKKLQKARNGLKELPVSTG